MRDSNVEKKMGYYEDGNKQYYTVDDKKVYINGQRVRGMVVKNDGNDVSIKTYRLDSPGMRTLRNIGRFVGGALTLAELVFIGYGSYKVGEDIRNYLVTHDETAQTEASHKPSDFVYVQDNSKGKAVLRYEAQSGETAESISDIFNRADQKDAFADATKYNVVFANGKYVSDAPLKEGQSVYVVTAQN